MKFTVLLAVILVALLPVAFAMIPHTNQQHRVVNVQRGVVAHAAAAPVAHVTHVASSHAAIIHHKPTPAVAQPHHTKAAKKASSSKKKHVAPRHIARKIAASNFKIVDVPASSMVGTAFDSVPYTDCGQSTDLFNITSFTSTVWPPELGTTATIQVQFESSEVVSSGTYSAAVSVDGFQILDKTGNLQKYLHLPIQEGPVSLTKNITLPSSSPVSGTIGIQLSAQDQASNELFCVSFSFDI